MHQTQAVTSDSRINPQAFWPRPFPEPNIPDSSLGAKPLAKSPRASSPETPCVE
jgi:hypothetical protein